MRRKPLGQGESPGQGRRQVPFKRVLFFMLPLILLPVMLNVSFPAAEKEVAGPAISAGPADPGASASPAAPAGSRPAVRLCAAGLNGPAIGQAAVKTGSGGPGSSGRLLFGGEDQRPLPDRVILPVKAMKQTDPAWAEARLGASTIGREGCALTCLAMYDTAYGHPETTPPSLRDELGEDAYPLEWEAYATLRGKEVCQRDDTLMEPHCLASRTYVEYTALRHLASGRPVIIGLYNKTSKGTHFVLAYGYEFKEGIYRMMLYDPAAESEERFFSDIGPNQGFCRLVVFK